jgi:hypothetical protein
LHVECALLRDATSSRGLERRVDLPLTLKPLDVARFGTLLNLPKQLDRVRFKARLTPIRIWNHSFDVNGNDKPIRAHKARTSNSFTR